MNKNIIEKLFIFISIFFGVILIIIIPPFNSPDEQSHFIRAYEISKGNFFPKKYGDKEGFLVSKNVVSFIKDMENYSGNYDKKYSYKDIYNENICPIDYNEEVVYQVSSQYLNIFPYIIPAIAIQITDYIPNISNSPQSITVMLQFARFALLIFNTIIGYYAVKITPKYKKSMFFILLMPMSLFLRSMVTYDGILITTSALSLAEMLKLIFSKKEKFSRLDFMILVFCGFILLNIKVLYSIIFLLMLCVPVSRFKDKKDQIKQYILMIILVLFLSLLFKIPTFFLSPANEMIVAYQKEWIFHHPIDTFLILSSNIFNQFNIQMYWMIGTYGLLDVYMPVIFIFIFYVYFLLIMINESLNEEIKINKFIKLLLCLLSIMVIYAIYYYMYANWTPLVTNIIGGNRVEGVQGRYFIPLLFIIPIVLSLSFINSNNKVFNKIKKILNNFVENSYVFFIIMILIISIIILLLRYYV